MLTFTNLAFILTFVGALGCGLMAGLYFAFSVSVMNGLSRLPPAEGIAAMRSINVAIINPAVMTAFFWNNFGSRLSDHLVTIAVARSRCRGLNRRGVPSLLSAVYW